MAVQQHSRPCRTHYPDDDPNCQICGLLIATHPRCHDCTILIGPGHEETGLTGDRCSFCASHAPARPEKRNNKRNRKLSAVDVGMIRLLGVKGLSHSEIAAYFPSITKANIGAILRWDTWRGVR